MMLRKKRRCLPHVTRVTLGRSIRTTKPVAIQEIMTSMRNLIYCSRLPQVDANGADFLLRRHHLRFLEGLSKQTRYHLLQIAPYPLLPSASRSRFHQNFNHLATIPIPLHTKIHRLPNLPIFLLDNLTNRAINLDSYFPSKPLSSLLKI